MDTLSDDPEVAALEYATLNRKANRDSLTGLLNREFFSDQTEMEHVLGRGRQFGCVFLDIDLFKNINDTYGHDAGDEVIIDTARIIKTHIRGMDLAARWGGEEFIIIIPDIHNLDELTKIAERLREDFQKFKIEVEDNSIERTCSLGVANGTGFLGASGLKSTIKNADKALYRAKESGRNKVVVFDNM